MQSKKGNNLIFIIISLLLVFNLTAAAEETFSVSAALRESDKGAIRLFVSFSIPEHHYLYAEQIKLKALGDVQLLPKKIPQAIDKYDEMADRTIAVYKQNATFIYTVKGNTKKPINIKVSYQGCSEKMCFLPASKIFSLILENGTRVIRNVDKRNTNQVAVVLSENWRKPVTRFNVAGRAVGYLKPDEFIAFLKTAESGKGPAKDKSVSVFEEKGAWVLVILIIIGGIALNLTPCVLPMIPINIAIIGAGATAGSRGRGFALGGAYGCAISIVYGMLGLIVVLTGSKFGALNSSPLFNAVVAVIFVILSLAMFDIFAIDFSRFQRGGGTGPQKRGSFFAAFFMGAIAALLAGACVAPVLISVLLLSANLYAQNNSIGIFLPFLLGIGMGLPWPFVGAGLSFLPKPGKWMTRVKYVFGILIIGFAIYYGHLAYNLFMKQRSESRKYVETTTGREDAKQDWLTSLPQALVLAEKEKKPLFIDFWGSACKSCFAMEKTTFKNQDIKNRLDHYIKVKYNVKDSAGEAVLDYFGGIGLPTYIVLFPKKKE